MGDRPVEKTDWSLPSGGSGLRRGLLRCVMSVVPEEVQDPTGAAQRGAYFRLEVLGRKNRKP